MLLLLNQSLLQLEKKTGSKCTQNTAVINLHWVWIPYQLEDGYGEAKLPDIFPS